VRGASETAALAALRHDLGKYAAEFRAMITASDPEAHLEGVATGPRKRVSHSSAGAMTLISALAQRDLAEAVECGFQIFDDSGGDLVRGRQ
jgi:hypothetical protein